METNSTLEPPSPSQLLSSKEVRVFDRMLSPTNDTFDMISMLNIENEEEFIREHEQTESKLKTEKPQKAFIYKLKKGMKFMFLYSYS